MTAWLVLAGGDANLAFREDEELKPYKEKSKASLFCASLDDDSFTIPAWTQDSSCQDASLDGGNLSVMMATTQPAATSVINDLKLTESTDSLLDYASTSSTPHKDRDTAVAKTASPASTASQTSPR